MYQPIGTVEKNRTSACSFSACSRTAFQRERAQAHGGRTGAGDATRAPVIEKLLYDRARRQRDDSARVGSCGSKQTAPAARWAIVVNICLLRRRRSPCVRNRVQSTTRP